MVDREIVFFVHDVILSVIFSSDGTPLTALYDKHCTYLSALHYSALLFACSYGLLHCTHCTFTVLYCDILYTVLPCTAQYHTMYCTIPYTILHYTIHCTALYHTLYCTIPYTVLHYTIHCTALYHTLYFRTNYLVMHYTILGLNAELKGKGVHVQVSRCELQ
jgi:hypothetical protein